SGCGSLCSSANARKALNTRFSASAEPPAAMLGNFSERFAGSSLPTICRVRAGRAGAAAGGSLPAGGVEDAGVEDEQETRVRLTSTAQRIGEAIFIAYVL